MTIMAGTRRFPVFALVGALLITVAMSLLACGSNVVSVGVVLPLSGEFAIYGDPIRKGIELAFEQITAGDYDYELELLVEDSQGDPARAASLQEEFYKNGVPAVIGGVTTDEALSMVEVADSFDKVMISPSASSPRLTGVSSNFFRVFPSDFLEGTRLGNFARQTLELDNIVILGAESPYAKGIQQVFRSEFERYNGKVLEVVDYPANTSDISGLIERVMTLNPNGVYLADYGEAVANMITTLRDAGFKGRILTTASFATPETIAQAGAAAEDVYLAQSVFDTASEEPAVREFVDAFKAKYGREPDLYAAHGYDAMRVWAEALHKGGKLRSEFWSGMRGLRDFPGVTGNIQFDEKGDVQKYPRVYIVNDGNLVDYDAVLEQRRQELMERMENLRRKQRGMRQSDG